MKNPDSLTLHMHPIEDLLYTLPQIMPQRNFRVCEGRRDASEDFSMTGVRYCIIWVVVWLGQLELQGE